MQARAMAAGAAQRGLALVAVLWVVAALALMVSGISQVLRSEVRWAGQQQTASIETAVADAAIRHLLVRLHHLGQTRHGRISRHSVQVLDRNVTLDLIPLNGWINLNHAPPSLLTDTLIHAAGIEPAAAQRLAQSIVQARQQPDAQGKPRQLHAVEDLLQLPDLGWDHYVALSAVLRTDLGSESAVPNPLVAPLPVLQVLAQGRGAVAQRIAEKRQTQGDTLDTLDLNGSHQQRSETQSVEIRAILASGDNTPLLRTWRVALATPAHGLPWRVLGKDPIRHARPSDNP